MDEEGPWGPSSSDRLGSLIVVVVAVGGVVGFLAWLNHFIDGIGF